MFFAWVLYWFLCIYFYSLTQTEFIWWRIVASLLRIEITRVEHSQLNCEHGELGTLKHTLETFFKAHSNKCINDGLLKIECRVIREALVHRPFVLFLFHEIKHLRRSGWSFVKRGYIRQVPFMIRNLALRIHGIWSINMLLRV